MSQPNNLNQPHSMPLPETLLQMLSGMWVSQSIYVAAKLGIADLLKQGAKTSEQLANDTDVDAQSLYRVLRALSSIGIFAEGENRLFELTPLATYLQSDSPSSMRAIAIMFGSEDWRWQTWGNILYSVKTGKSAFEHTKGIPIFNYFSQNPEAAEIFNASMTSFSTIHNAAIAASYDFSSIKTLVDVGGGHGGFLSAILKANPMMKGILYDLPPVIEGARQHLEVAGLQERCLEIQGNFFESVPSGGDAYMLKNIIHDWNDESAIAILKNCHRAMPDNGKLLLVETVIPSGNEPSVGKFVDIEMLLMTSGGRERTEAEFQNLFRAAGFKLTSITPTQSPLSVIEGVRV